MSAWGSNHTDKTGRVSRRLPARLRAGRAWGPAEERRLWGAGCCRLTLPPVLASPQPPVLLPVGPSSKEYGWRPRRSLEGAPMSLRVTPRLSETPRAPGSQLRFNIPTRRSHLPSPLLPPQSSSILPPPAHPETQTRSSSGRPAFRGELSPRCTCGPHRAAGADFHVVWSSARCGPRVPRLPRHRPSLGGLKHPLVRHSSGGQKGGRWCPGAEVTVLVGRAPSGSSPSF